MCFAFVFSRIFLIFIVFVPLFDLIFFTVLAKFRSHTGHTHRKATLVLLASDARSDVPRTLPTTPPCASVVRVKNELVAPINYATHFLLPRLKIRKMLMKTGVRLGSCHKHNAFVKTDTCSICLVQLKSAQRQVKRTVSLVAVRAVELPSLVLLCELEEQTLHLTERSSRPEAVFRRRHVTVRANRVDHADNRAVHRLENVDRPLDRFRSCHGHLERVQ